MAVLGNVWNKKDTVNVYEEIVCDYFKNNSKFKGDILEFIQRCHGGHTMTVQILGVLLYLKQYYGEKGLSDLIDIFNTNMLNLFNDYIQNLDDLK